MMSQFSVQDRVAVVTGGLGQLGTQFTKTLAEAGLLPKGLANILLISYVEKANFTI